MTPLNNDLIDRVLARIERDPAAWDQGDFAGLQRSEGNVCGTKACFAGHTLLESGWTMEIAWNDYGRAFVQTLDPNGQITGDFEEPAAELLGFTDDEVEKVFYETQTRSVAEMRAVIAKIRANRAEINKDVTPG